MVLDVPAFPDLPYLTGPLPAGVTSLVFLLRGINVGGSGKLAMADITKLLEMVEETGGG